MKKVSYEDDSLSGKRKEVGQKAEGTTVWVAWVNARSWELQVTPSPPQDRREKKEV